MSLDLNPDWTKEIAYIGFDDFKCPICGQKANNQEEILSELFTGNYYTVRNIPENLIFTCDNKNCTHCDEEYEYSLSVEITAKPKK